MAKSSARRRRLLSQSGDLLTSVALYFGVTAWFLHGAAGFSLKTSMMLAGVVALWSGFDWGRRQPHLEAFQVVFEPRIGLMLERLGLLDEAGWQSLLETTPIPVYPWDGRSLCATGVTAALLPGQSVEIGARRQKAIHWMEPNRYRDDFELEIELKFLSFATGSQSWSPAFMIDGGLFRGQTPALHIGIKVSHEWWKQNEARLQEQGGVSPRWVYEHSTLIVLETLPLSAFWEHERFGKWTKALEAERDEDLARTGWTRQFVESEDEMTSRTEHEFFQSKFAAVRVGKLGFWN